MIDLSKVGTNIGIRANIPGGTSTGVVFTLSGPYSRTQSEGKVGPWSLFGDIGVNVNKWPSSNLKTGSYSLKIWTNNSTTTVNFQIISGTTANARDINPVASFTEFGVPQVVSIYPNPVMDSRLNVAFSQPISGPVSYTIFDPTGKSIQLEEIQTQRQQMLELRLSETVTPGIYYLKLKSREHGLVWHHRFIKSH